MNKTQKFTKEINIILAALARYPQVAERFANYIKLCKKRYSGQGVHWSYFALYLIKLNSQASQAHLSQLLLELDEFTLLQRLIALYAPYQDLLECKGYYDNLAQYVQTSGISLDNMDARITAIHKELSSDY